LADAASGWSRYLAIAALGSNERCVERRSHSPRRHRAIWRRGVGKEGESLARKQALEPRQQNVSNAESLAPVNTIASGCSRRGKPPLEYHQNTTLLFTSGLPPSQQRGGGSSPRQGEGRLRSLRRKSAGRRSDK
jgi:hypothetical protein